MLALRLPPDIEARLDALAREAILRQIEDIENEYLAPKRLARGGPRVSLESLKRELGKSRSGKSAR